LPTIKEQYILDIKNKASDKWGMVLPQITWTDSGNGIYYTALDMTLRDRHDVAQRENFITLVDNCTNNRGVLMRTPDNSYGQEQWDNYLGVFIGAITICNVEIVKKFLKTAFKNKFVLDTDGKVELKDFLLRFPHIWALYGAFSYKPVKYLLWPVLHLVSKLSMRPTLKTGGSGINLQYMFNYAMSKLYSDKYLKNWLIKLTKLDKSLGSNFMEYFSAEHPFSLLETAAETNKLTTVI